MPWDCSICTSRSDRPAIDDALKGGTSIRQVARAFGLGRTSVSNHAGRCLGVTETRERSRAARGQPRRKRPSQTAEVRPIESPQDVLQEVQRMYQEAWALYEEAKRTSDTRLMDKALGQVGSTIDRFAKVYGMFKTDIPLNDNRTVNVFANVKPEDLLELRRALGP
jgi:transposase